MIEVDLQQAEGHLEELVEEAAAGEDVLIVSASGATVRLVPLSQRERKQATSGKPVGHALDRYMGTLSAEQAAEILQAVEVFEQIDPSFWK